MFLLLTALLLTAAGATLVLSALAASASCEPGWDWANNTLNQNPCEVAGALEASCQGFSVYVLGPISQGANYVAPQKNSSADICECNTVMYSLYMACTACQNVSIEPWSFWEKNCDSVYVAQYPNYIPIGTAVPHWAYLDVTKNNDTSFDPVLAKAAGDSPEVLPQTPTILSLTSTSTLLPSSSTGPSIIGSSGASSSLGGINSPSPTHPNPQHKDSLAPNAGAIAGGAISGFVGLGIIGGLIAWCRIRQLRRYSNRSDAIYRDYTQQYSPDTQMSQAPMKLYDPEDPTTFPPGTTIQGSDLMFPSAGLGQYTGAAEL